MNRLFVDFPNHCRRYFNHCLPSTWDFSPCIFHSIIRCRISHISGCLTTRLKYDSYLLLTVMKIFFSFFMLIKTSLLVMWSSQDILSYAYRPTFQKLLVFLEKFQWVPRTPLRKGERRKHSNVSFSFVVQYWDHVHKEFSSCV